MKTLKSEILTRKDQKVAIRIKNAQKFAKTLQT